MFSVFKQGRKVSLDFLIFLIIYAVFLPLLVTFAKVNTGKWTPLYSLLVCIFLTSIVWFDVYEQGEKEKKPIYKLNPSPHKGALIGFLGMAPYIVLTIAAFIFTATAGVDLEFTSQINSIVNNAFLSPVYFISSGLGGGIFAYIAAVCYIPLVCYLAYMAGNKGITKRGIINKIKAMKKPQQSEDR